MDQSNLTSHLERREELRRKIKAFGAASLTDEENLEILLSYCTRSDTAPAANALMKEFGSLKRVMESTVGALVSVEEVTPQMALST